MRKTLQLLLIECAECSKRSSASARRADLPPPVLCILRKRPVAVCLAADGAGRAHIFASDDDRLGHHAAALAPRILEATHNPQILLIGRLRRMHRTGAPQESFQRGLIRTERGSTAATRSSPCATAAGAAASTSSASAPASASPATTPAGEGAFHEAAGDVIGAPQGRKNQTADRGEHQQSYSHALPRVDRARAPLTPGRRFGSCPAAVAN